MVAFLLYLLKSSGIAILFLACYYLFLRKTTFFQENRFFMLVGLISALFIPLIHFTRVVEISTVTQLLSLQPTGIHTTKLIKSGINWPAIAITIYSIVATLLLIRLLVQSFSLLTLIKSAKKLNLNGISVLKSNQDLMPCSFFKSIIINPNNINENELTSILAHENCHAREWHSVDIIIANLISILLWFNPFIWYYQSTMRQNLEYIADCKALINNKDSKGYQYLLLQNHLRKNHLTLTNSFFNTTSSLKKRIVMLNQTRSTKFNLLNYVAVLPLLTIFFFLFQTTTVAQKSNSKKSADFSDKAKDSIQLVENTPLVLLDGLVIPYPNLHELDPKTIASINVIKNGEATRKYGESAKYGVVEVNTKRGPYNDVVIDKEKSGDFGIISSKTGPTSTFYKSPDKNKLSQPIYIIDGLEVSKLKFEDIDPADIKSINVFKDEYAIEKYGQKGKNGVVEVIMKQ